MNLSTIRAELTSGDRKDEVALALIYLADTLESALHEVADRVNDLGTSIEEAGVAS